MERGDFVYHLNYPGQLLKVISPAAKNGGKKIVCESIEDLIIYTVEGSPEFFRLAVKPY